jgi:Na+/H+-dicarboxylate symporter
MTLGFAMISSPGVPGGSIMTALPFLYILNISSTGPLASLLITLYITQDSFGTATNISGDTALALIIDKLKK